MKNIILTTILLTTICSIYKNNNEITKRRQLPKPSISCSNNIKNCVPSKSPFPSSTGTNIL